MRFRERLEAVERLIRPKSKPSIVFLENSPRMRDGDLMRAMAGEHEWVAESGESLSAFKDRVVQAAAAEHEAFIVIALPRTDDSERQVRT
jgi:hypothetical protein